MSLQRPRLDRRDRSDRPHARSSTTRAVPTVRDKGRDSRRNIVWSKPGPPWKTNTGNADGLPRRRRTASCPRLRPKTDSHRTTPLKRSPSRRTVLIRDKPSYAAYLKRFALRRNVQRRVDEVSEPSRRVQHRLRLMDQLGRVFTDDLSAEQSMVARRITSFTMPE